jgi:hypothetical protein
MAGEMADLTQREMDVFNAEWDSFVALHYPERDFVDVFEDNKSQILDTLKISKFQLEVEFGGIHAATNQFGWTMIQPNFVLATTTPTYETSTWMKNYATSDVTTIWKDLWGTSTTDKQVSKYATMILLGFYDPVDVPKVSAIKAKIKGDEYPIWWIENAIRSGLHIYELPQPIVIEKEQTYYIQAKIARAGDDELQPFGVYFGRGDHLRSKTAYAQI